jgi:UDP-3-O-[3-hydroxymyristoyl] glucosamine N-acyltransferase LpxD
MGLVKPAQASVLAAFLKVPLCGADVTVDRVASLGAVEEGALTFLQRFNPGAADHLNRLQRVFVLADPSSEGRLACSHVIVADPRLAFARVAQEFFEPRVAPVVASTAQVHPGARIGRDVAVGHFSVVDDNVEIGDGTVLGDHVVIRARTRIGKRCIIRSNVVIGEPGFGFDFDHKTPMRLPHFGGVVIGDDVQVGCGSTICCATMDETRIGNHVKIDDQVVIAHNVVIGEGSIITAGAVVCGQVRLGRHVWVGANSTIRQGGVDVGDDAMVGLGAVAVVPIQPRQVVMGNPARVLRMRKVDEEF